jgi:hypothetical protein
VVRGPRGSFARRPQNTRQPTVAADEMIELVGAVCCDAYIASWHKADLQRALHIVRFGSEADIGKSLPALADANDPNRILLLRIEGPGR